MAYYIYNGHGDVVDLISPLGVSIITYDYDAFGNLLEEDGTGFDNPFKFAGELLDSETGYYIMGARYYAPNLGRWISEDSLLQVWAAGQGQKAVHTGSKWFYRVENDTYLTENYVGTKYYDYISGRNIIILAGIDDVNWYSYCRANPLIYVDPDGEFVATIFGAVTGGIVGGVNAWLHNKDIRTGIISGAVSGAVVGASVDIVVATGGAGLAIVGGAAAGGGIGGFLGNVIDQVGNQMAQGEDFSVAVQHLDFKSAGISASIGVVSGAVGGGTSVALSKLVPTTHNAIKVSMNHMEKTIRQLLAKNVSDDVVDQIVNAAISSCYEAARTSANAIITVEVGSTVIYTTMQTSVDNVMQNQF